MLKIELFGVPRLSIQNEPVNLVRRKVRALLYYLASVQEPVHRSRLVSIFWPDMSRASALQNLRTLLHSLRVVLETYIDTDGELISLVGDIWVDTREFESRLAKPRDSFSELINTLDLYKGEFLFGFDLPDTDSFEYWLTVQREHYHKLAVRGWTQLADAYEDADDFSRALDSLEKALFYNPLQEDLQRESMRLMYLAGDRPAAIRRYDDLRKLLDEQLGVLPMRETRNLYDAILTDQVEKKPTKQPAASSTGNLRTIRVPQDELPFTGRLNEMEVLEKNAWTHKLILIDGEPGVGKTRLAEEFARSSQSFVLIGQGRELEQNIPYHSITEALRGLVRTPSWQGLLSRIRKQLPKVWLAEASRLLPELATDLTDQWLAGQTQEESRLWEGIHQFLLAIAQIKPIILIMDDLEWADISTLGLLGYLVRHSSPEPISFLATIRTIPPRNRLQVLLTALQREDRLIRLTLPRLKLQDVDQIIGGLNYTTSDWLREWLWRNSEGNPYILRELIRYSDKTLESPDSSQADVNPVENLVVPSSIYELIRSRLLQMNDASRRILDVGVAAGREFEFSVVANASGISEMAAFDALDELVSYGLIQQVDESHYRFDHALTMEVAYRELGEARHRRLHYLVAESIERLHKENLDEMVGLLVWHFTEGNAPERAAPYAYRGGQLAARLAAWPEAIAYYQQALHSVSGLEKISILLALGDAYLNSGQFPQATANYEEVLTQGRTEISTRAKMDIQTKLTRSLLPQARFAEVIEIAHEFMEYDLPGSDVKAHILWGTALSIEGSDLTAAADHLAQAEELWHSASPADPLVLAQIQFERGSVAAQQGDLPQAVQYYRQSLETALSGDSDAANELIILGNNNLAYHLHLMGDPTAQNYARRGLEIASEKGVIGLQAYLKSTLGEIALSGGDLDTAEKYFTEGMEIANQANIPERVVGLNANLGLVAIRRGQVALAIHRLSSALAQTDALGFQHLGAQIRIWLAPLLPEPERSKTLADARWMTESSGRKFLLSQILELEKPDLGDPAGSYL